MQSGIDGEWLLEQLKLASEDLHLKVINGILCLRILYRIIYGSKIFTRVAKASWMLRRTIKSKPFCLLQACSCFLISERYITSVPVHLPTCLESVLEIFLD